MRGGESVDVSAIQPFHICLGAVFCAPVVFALSVAFFLLMQRRSRRA
jgi:hypothetical protein